MHNLTIEFSPFVATIADKITIDFSAKAKDYMNEQYKSVQNTLYQSVKNIETSCINLVNKSPEQIQQSLLMIANQELEFNTTLQKFTLNFNGLPEHQVQQGAI